MIYVEQIQVTGDNYPGSHVLDKDFVIKCGEVNLFVGDQGCGKSTMLNMMQQNHEDIQLKLSDYTLENGVKTFYFDSEKDNPRMKNPELFTKPSGEDIGIGYGAALASRFNSHGEILETFVITPLNKAENCVVMLDEPESALSITNQFKLIDAIRGAVERGCQLFIATHCYPLIQEFDVISLEHNKQMSGKEFIELIKNK